MENFNKSSFVQNTFNLKKSNINNNIMIEKQAIKPKINNNLFVINKYNDSISTPSSISSISSSSSSSSSSSFCFQNDSNMKYR